MTTLTEPGISCNFVMKQYQYNLVPVEKLGRRGQVMLRYGIPSVILSIISWCNTKYYLIACQDCKTGMSTAPLCCRAVSGQCWLKTKKANRNTTELLVFQKTEGRVVFCIVSYRKHLTHYDIDDVSKACVLNDRQA